MGACIDNSKIVIQPHVPHSSPHRPARKSKLRPSQIPTYPSIEDILREEQISNYYNQRSEEMR